MDKKYLSHLKSRVTKLRIRYLLAALATSLLVCSLSMRSNNLHMIKLRNAVFQADEANGDVEGALYSLRTYIYAHMNTSLKRPDGVYPPIQLQYTYQRLLQAEEDKVKDQSGSVYTDAQKYCEQQNSTSFSGRNRVPCIEDYVQAHGVQKVAIPSAMYKFDFVSPRWSPDLAGFSLLVTWLLAAVLVGRIALALLFKLLRI